MSGAEIRVATDFLSSMLQMDPKDRVTPSELVKHRWLSAPTQNLSNNSCVCGIIETEWRFARPGQKRSDRIGLSRF